MKNRKNKCPTLPTNNYAKSFAKQLVSLWAPHSVLLNSPSLNISASMDPWGTLISFIQFEMIGAIFINF